MNGIKKSIVLKIENNVKFGSKNTGEKNHCKVTCQETYKFRIINVY